ncbi:MAG: WGR domain-containing protein [Candidatus Competibacteraceae bacterium]
MSEEKTYLELSEADGVSHKFYEVIIDGTQVSIRYGRIGTDGQTKVTGYPNPDKAQAAAAKKIAEKRRKGYEPAVMGVRKKRAITRRQVTSQRSTAKHQAPVLWKFVAGSPAFGIFIEAGRCWLGNQAGEIFVLDHQGEVLNKFQLPDGVKCIVADADWLYAGCDDGKVYDLSGKIPYVAYEIADDVDIYWLDIRDGILGISDAGGQVTTINHEEESFWTCKSQGSHGWMVRCDELGVYHGHSGGVTMYDWEDGSLIWHQPTQGEVLFGWQEESAVYAGTRRNKVHRFAKKGEPGAIYNCDAPVYSCATAEDGKYVFAGDNSSSIYCFDEAGERLWKLNSGCGSALSMQFFQDRLYIVTTNGQLACIDAGEVAIEAAQAGTVPQAVAIQAPSVAAVQPATVLETTADASGGVLLECLRDSGKLRVRVVSPGYHADWWVQFPRNLREEGARYRVDAVRESARGGFYRAHGEIKQVV